MTLSDKINVSLCILSFLLAAISVITVVITLRQNHKMIENSTRPYVIVTGQKTNFQEPMFYVVLKNYGTSGAKIIQLSFDIDIAAYSLIPEIEPFGYVKGMFIAPGQIVSSVFDKKKFNENKIDTFNATITYSDGIHEYKETYPISYKGLSHNVSYKAATKGEELRIISYALQELVEKQL